MAMKPHNSLLSQIRANRRGLRSRGLTAADILALEAVAAVAPSGSRRLSVAALGRLIGVSRVAAWKRIKRLEAAGAVIRMRRTLILNVRGVLGWLEAAVKDRLASVKRRFSLAKSQNVNHRVTDNRIEKERGLEYGPLIDWTVGDSGPDGRKIIGHRRFGALTVPVWG